MNEHLPSLSRRFKLIIVGVCSLLLLGGIYGIYMIWSLNKPVYVPPQLASLSEQKSGTSTSEDTDDSLYIPSIGAYMTYKAGDQKVLDDGAWHRYPERGDPEKGGNFVLAGHRFRLGITPSATKVRSPLYNVYKLKEADQIVVTFKNKVYFYTIKKIYDVKPDRIDIEAPSTTPKLTLYTCTVGGASDGRLVIEATLESR